ncbi:MAG TPA: MFS transporter [Verrucomicrobiae bacterium]|nr:MFS transporter [Verrucomicrobiae bacterium]
MRELFSGRRGRVAAGLLVSELSTATQALVIAAIMPRVVGDLGGLGEYPLAFGAFFAAMLIFSPFAGPWGDRYGTRRVFAAGSLTLFAGLAMAALAPTMAAFTAARFVEGAGDALESVMAFSAIAKSFEESLRPRMLSLLSAAWVLPAIAGPGLGALVTTLFGWRWAFAAFLPIVAIAALLVIPSIERHAVDESADAFAALRTLFSVATLRVRPGMPAALVAFALLHAGFFGGDAYVALMLTSVRGISLGAASLCITAAAIGWAIAAGFQPKLYERSGAVAMVGAAAACALFACAAMTAVALGAPLALAYTAWALGGAGIGLGYPTIMLVTLASAGEGSEGTASSAALLAGIGGMLAGIMLCGIPVTLAAHGATSLALGTAMTFAVACGFAALLAASAARLR